MTQKRNGLPEGYEWLLQPDKAAFHVAVRSRTKAELLADASQEQRAELEDLLVRFSTLGPPGLPRTKLNGNEGWFPSDRAPGKVRLQAFKPWQLRAYGFCRDVNGQATFIITGIDCSKKRDKANQAKLNAAGTEAFETNKLFK